MEVGKVKPKKIFDECYFDLCLEVYRDRVMISTWGKVIEIKGRIKEVIEK